MYIITYINNALYYEHSLFAFNLTAYFTLVLTVKCINIVNRTSCTFEKHPLILSYGARPRTRSFQNKKHHLVSEFLPLHES